MEAQSILRGLRATSSLNVRRQCQYSLSRHLHSTATKEATPIAHPTVPGPPPQAPQAAASHPQDRVARKRAIAETLRQNRENKTNTSKPSSTTPLRKRFWKDVHIKEADGGYEVHLDTRAVRTASRAVLKVPSHKKALAAAISIEWDQLVSAQQALKSHYIPLTSLTSRAVDIEDSDSKSGPERNMVRQAIVQTVMRYFSTDTLLCWAPEKNIYDHGLNSGKPLRHRQREVAEPIIAFLTTHIFPGVEIVPILGEDSIVPVSQPEMTHQVMKGWVSGLPAWELAGLERGVLATKSLLVAARLLVEWSAEFEHLRKEREDQEAERARFDIEKAAEAANLEVLHQTAQWGEVEDTHDVEKEDLRRQLGSVVLLVS